MTRRHGVRTPPRDDAGFTLIEVLVALLVFAILATGIVAGMVTITRMTGDNRARIVAANLAAQDLDLVRAVADPFKVTGTVGVPTTVGGRTYTVTRTISWVSQAGGDVSCNSSTNLFFLRVNVRVTWPGQLGTTSAVQDDTILAPAGRMSDSSSGAIAVSVVGADGAPESGISVTITPTSGGRALTVQPAATGADGCTYAAQVVPGTYSVRVSRNGWVDTAQAATPTKSVAVGVGTTQSASFQFDQAATYTTNYAPNYPGRLLPSSLHMNFYNTSIAPAGVYSVAPTTPATNVKLHPFASGYSVILGRNSSGTFNCASMDPEAWVAGTSETGVPLAGGVRPAAAVAAGGTVALNIPMGVVTVQAAAGQTWRAVQTTATGAGNPGCGTPPVTYTFPTLSTGAPQALALPYGSWKISAGSTPITTGLSVPTNAGGGGVAGDGTVTLDPRPAA